jgi:hypothetical protein
MMMIVGDYDDDVDDDNDDDVDDDNDDGRCCWMTAGPDCDSHRYFGLMMMIGFMHYHIRCHYCSYVFWIDYE